VRPWSISLYDPEISLDRTWATFAQIHVAVEIFPGWRDGRVTAGGAILQFPRTRLFIYLFVIYLTLGVPSVENFDS
jgi:hypothetical protein